MMIEIKASWAGIQALGPQSIDSFAALDGALRAALGIKCFGVSSFGDGLPVSVFLDDTATAGDQATAVGVVTAHDPIYISIDKVQIAADGVDTATVTVTAPKVGAAAVTLTIAGTDYLLTLTNGVATVPITCQDPMTINIAVKNPTGRIATSTFSIMAV